MDDLTCTDCQEKFEYKSLLLRHKNSKKKCGVNKSVLEIECQYCNKTYATKNSLIRHYTICKNKNNIPIQEAINQNNNNSITNGNTEINIKSNISDSDTSDTLDIINLLLGHITKLNNSNEKNNTLICSLENVMNIIGNIINILRNNNSINSIIPKISIPNTSFDNIINSNSNLQVNINNGNINNGVVNNTISNMQLVYPFGMENIDYLSNQEKIRMLKSPNGLVLALKSVYSRMENNSFHKRNLNKDSMTYVNSNLELDNIREPEFKKKLITQAIFLLRRIFFSCKNSLSIPHQLLIWKNLKRIEEQSNDKKILDEISNLIELKSENSIIKEHFTNLKKKINNSDYKNQCLQLIQKIIEDINNYKKDFSKVSLSDQSIKDESWIRDENDSNDLLLDNEDNDVNYNYIQDTPRFKFFNEMEQCELRYFSTKQSHDLSVGDIDFICNRDEKKKYAEYNLLCSSYNPDDETRQEIRTKLFNEPLQKSKDDLCLVRFTNNLQIQQ